MNESADDLPGDRRPRGACDTGEAERRAHSKSPSPNGDPRVGARPPVSILFPNAARTEQQRRPPFFADLLLDQVVDTLTAHRTEYNLAEFFHTPLPTRADVEYRQQVFLDLDGTALAEQLARFGRRMAGVRRALAYADSVRDAPHVSSRWVLDAACDYVAATRDLATDLAAAHPRSTALRAVRDYLADYLNSTTFNDLARQARTVADGLEQVRYSFTAKGLHVTVRPYQEEDDYAAQVLSTFERFRHGEAKKYQVDYRDVTSVGHIEAQLLDRVARLFPAPFAALGHFSRQHRDFLDPAIARFDREAQFYLAYLDHLRPLRAAGLQFCYPNVLDARQIDVRDTFDLSLAAKLIREDAPVVRNDIRTSGRERIIVVTGPNQGGKTTYARTLGQLCHLARLGLPVPGTSARLPLVDHLHAHFERGENLTDLRGKLQDDLIRIREILHASTGRSLIILNEIFTSTTLHDALALSTRILQQVTDLDALCVCVTFIDELATMNEKTTSVVAGVDPHDPTVRTFRLERRPPDGRAYAAALAAKHKLTYQDIVEVLGR